MSRRQYDYNNLTGLGPVRRYHNLRLMARVRFGSKLRCARWHSNMQEKRQERVRAEVPSWGAW